MSSESSIAATLPIELVRDILDAAVRVYSVGALKWTTRLLLVSRDIYAWLLPAVYGVFIVKPQREALPWETPSPYPGWTADVSLSSGSSRQLEWMLRNPEDPRRAVIKTIIIMGSIPALSSEAPCAPWTVPILIGTYGLISNSWPLYGVTSYAGRADAISRQPDPMFWNSRYDNNRTRTRAVRIQFQRENEWLQFIERTSEAVDNKKTPVHIHLQIELNYMFDRSVGPLVELAQRILQSRPEARFVLCTRHVASHARAAARARLIAAFEDIPRARLTWSTYFWDDSPRIRPGGHLEYLREGRDPWEIGVPL